VGGMSRIGPPGWWDTLSGQGMNASHGRERDKGRGRDLVLA
jgi:hypothetical protein